MTRATVDFGIDLGTTNSAIAAANAGRIEILKNNDNQDITPSAVQITATGAIIVGRKAYEHHRSHSEGDVYLGVKRQLGKKHQRFPFAAAGVEKSPEELSSEILKSLKSDAESWIGEPIDAAVITVPAAFELAQCEATQRAAQLAGITQAPLLQEPIAAGLAYGYEQELDSGYFIVYDLGGGTFDATLLQVRDGHLAIVDHDGHNFLGSRDWDRRLAGLISSRLEALGYEFEQLNDPKGSHTRRRLEALAEEEKIRLSRVDQVDVLFDGSIKDATGRQIEESITVTRAEYESLIADDIERTIALTEKMIQHTGLKAADIATMIPVGGPTLTPLLRESIAARIAIPIETRIDPMTVVARGAAQFAAGVPLEGSVGSSVADVDAMDVNLSYPRVTDDEEATIGGRFEGEIDPGSVVEIRRADGAWASGRIPVEDGTFMVTVAIAPGQVNTFELSLFGASGSRISISIDRFAITHGLTAADPPLSRPISVLALDASDSESIITMLDKGTALPAVKEHTFKTVRELLAGAAGEALRIEFLEGTDKRAHVGTLTIDSDQVGRSLPVGTPVDVKISIDKSKTIVASAYISLADLTIEDVLQDKYRPEIDLETVSADLEQGLDRARELAEGHESDLAQLEKDASEVEQNIQAARGGDRDAADRADSALAEFAASVKRLEAETEGSRLAEHLKSERDAARDVVQDVGDVDSKVKLAELESETDRALSSGDIQRMKVVATELDDLYWDVVMAQPSFWVDVFIERAEAVQSGSKSAAASSLLQLGRQALDQGDIGTLKRVYFDLEAFVDDGVTESTNVPKRIDIRR